MRRRSTSLLLVLLFFALPLLAHAEDARFPVRVYQVAPTVFEDTLNTLGTIHAQKEVKLGFESAGTIEALHFDEGQVVEIGALLGQLNPEEQQIDLLHNKARLAVEETALLRARKKFENHRLLHEAGSILQSRLDEVELEVKEAELSVQAAKLKVQYSETVLEKTRLLAPIAGTIAVKHAEAGETVTGNTLVATLVDYAEVYCEIEITEQEYYRVRVGAPAILNTDALPNNLFRGTVQSVPPVLTGRTRSIRVRIRVADAQKLLLPGMLVHSKVLLYRKENALVIPAESVRWVRGKPFVFVVDPRENVALLKPVAVAYQGAELTEISEGLQAGDQVIVTQGFTQDKVPVEIVETEIPFITSK